MAGVLQHIGLASSAGSVHLAAVSCPASHKRSVICQDRRTAVSGTQNCGTALGQFGQPVQS